MLVEMIWPRRLHIGRAQQMYPDFRHILVMRQCKRSSSLIIIG